MVTPLLLVGLAMELDKAGGVCTGAGTSRLASRTWPELMWRSCCSTTSGLCGAGAEKRTSSLSMGVSGLSTGDSCA